MFDAELGPGRKRMIVGFAGGGGACFGLRDAFGFDPDVAINHWHVAINAHWRHFPQTAHYLTDIFELDPREVFPGEPIGLAWFSPDCTDHSKAKGKAPKSERIRGLAWCILPWAKFRKPDVILMENVEEWNDWGPVYRCPDDWRAKGVPGAVGEPIKALRGQTHDRFVRRLERDGYTVEIHYGRAADYGVPTTRNRLVLVARRDGQPIVWPAPTHAPRKTAAQLGLEPWRGAYEVIDFTERCPSIFLTREEARTLRRTEGVNCKRPLVVNTLRRVARGIERYVIGAAEPFIVPITHAGDVRVHGVTEPLRTLTASSRGDFALVAATIAELAHGDHERGAGERVRGVEDPLRTVHAQGGSHALVASALVRTDMQSAAERNGIHDVEDPMRTATSAGGFALMSAAIVGCGGRRGQSPPVDTQDPMPTVTGRNDACLATAFLVPRYGERDGQQPRCRTVEEPYPSPVPDGNGGGLAAIHLHQANTRDVGGDAAEPLRTPTGHGHQGVVAACLTRQFGTSNAADLADPVPTVMPDGGGKTHVMSAFMAQANGERLGRPATEPVTTLTERATQQQLVAASLQSYYGTGTGSDCAEPVRVVPTEDRHALIAACLEQAATGLVGHAATEPVSTIVGKGCTQRLIQARLELEGGSQARRADVLAFLWSHFGEPSAEEWDDPAGTLKARLKFGLVILSGQTWMIVDIGLRMLKARELGGAMGLPAGIDLETDVHGRPINTTDQVNMIGNMVCPGLVEAVAIANAPDWTIPEGVAA